MINKSLSTQAQVIAKLQKEASRQAKIEQRHLLPKEVSSVAGLINRYPWQTLAISSLLTTIILKTIIN
jgi:hypothetical protein